MSFIHKQLKFHSKRTKASLCVRWEASREGSLPHETWFQATNNRQVRYRHVRYFGNEHVMVSNGWCVWLKEMWVVLIIFRCVSKSLKIYKLPYLCQHLAPRSNIASMYSSTWTFSSWATIFVFKQSSDSPRKLRAEAKMMVGCGQPLVQIQS